MQIHKIKLASFAKKIFLKVLCMKNLIFPPPVPILSNITMLYISGGEKPGGRLYIKQKISAVGEGVTNGKRIHGLKIPIMLFESAFRREVLIVNQNMSFHAGTVCRLLTDLGTFEEPDYAVHPHWHSTMHYI